MKITVCIGSACHLKGARQVLEELQYLVSENHLQEQVELRATFCMGKCQEGVCVTVGDTVHSVSPDGVKTFFETELLAATER